MKNLKTTTLVISAIFTLVATGVGLGAALLSTDPTMAVRLTSATVPLVLGAIGLFVISLASPKAVAVATINKNYNRKAK